MTDDLKKLPEDQRIKMQATPMLASVHWSFEDDTIKDSELWFEEFNRLDLAIRYGLGEKQVSQAILSFAKKYDIYKKEYIGEISRIIREVYSRNLREEDIRRRLVEKINLKPNELDLAMEDLKQIVLLVKELGRKAEQKEKKELASQYEYLNITNIAQNYPQALQQIVTSQPIKLETYNQFVHPSVKNWLDDYLEKMGAGKHTSLQRSHYLFNTENTKKLKAIERQKVAELIESYDEGRRMIFNKANKKIEFGKGDILEENIERELEQQGHYNNLSNIKKPKISGFRQQDNLMKKKREIKKRVTQIELGRVNTKESKVSKGKEQGNEQRNDRNILDLSNY
jgi:hypothetical protein